MLRSKEYYDLHAATCKTFAHPKRLMVMSVLRDSELTVSEISNLTEIDHSNLSQHLHVLREGGVVAFRREGTKIYYRIAHPNINKAIDLMGEFLESKIIASHELINKKPEQVKTSV